MSLSKIIHDCLCLDGPSAVGLYLKPNFKVLFSKRKLEEYKENIKGFCDRIPEESLTGITVLKRHTEQNQFYAHALLAMAKHLEIWDVFPDADLLKDCNVEFFPYAKKRRPLDKKNAPKGEENIVED